MDGENASKSVTENKILYPKFQYAWLLFTGAPSKIQPRDFWRQNCHRIIQFRLLLANIDVPGELSEEKRHLHKVINGSCPC